VLAILAHVVLKHTAFGRRVYAIGGNEEATALSGINTRSVKFFTYVICGGLSAVTGMLFVARFQSAQADAGKGMELDAIAATVIRGTSLMGGQGTVVGVLIGAVLVSLIAIQLVRVGVQLGKGKATLGFEPLWAPREALPKRVGLVLITITFIVAIRWAGLTLSLFVALAVALYLMGVRKLVPLVAVPLAVAASAYLLFIAALDSDLPRGPVEELLAAVFRSRE